MITLGIETSCDETSASVVKDGREVLSNVVASSLNLHKKFGGIVPEIASRAHLESINFVVSQALKESKKKLKDINLIAVTSDPGLIGSLLVGVSFARALSFALRKPLVEVDHVKAHLYASFFEKSAPRFPFVGLVISGGHTNLYRVNNFFSFKLLGTTLDDAAGEAFDKVAKILDLGFPGGPIIDKISAKVKNNRLRFNYSQLPGTFNFSFSGLKTAVLYYVNKNQHKKDFSPKCVAASFQEAVVDNLVEKSIFACKKLRIRSLVLGGGVVANSRLRTKLSQEAEYQDIKVYFPQRNLCLDNAAMVAGLGFQISKTGGAIC
ncbi:MAG: tRNA (adenosine(37)-N6)-threonylcarbamoyltransferase complex transferase subunit TsaD [Candidatus Omnitrophica bacterium]|nr:tRNA (adenosine(37)-N6)-threonylcarbamoyltransferase complex transferase subunit TsaD [Candidatus Omnitrophota bacterium]HOX54170.1 tRNA (adenosine(37)-N6)-threonylcarbamoyltransferase complex transferase subunit TsaD [Candidatus Omnitrophota bacterium]